MNYMIKTVFWVNREGMSIATNMRDDLKIGDKIDILNGSILSTTVEISDIRIFSQLDMLCINIKGEGTTKDDWVSRKYINQGYSIRKVI